METVEVLQQKVKDLESKLEKSNVKSEQFFQSILQERYNAKHQRCPLGITDLTNNDFNAEIKEWEKYSDGIGQLIRYNLCVPRLKMILFCFGAKPVKVKLDLIVELCRKYEIDLRHLNQNGDEEILSQVVINDPYREYCQTHIVKTDNRNDYIQWNVLREHFRIWHDQKFPEKVLNHQAAHIKVYFTGYLGGWHKTRVNNVQVNGFLGVKLVG